MFDFLSLQGTNQSSVKPICLIDTKEFEIFFSLVNRLLRYARNDRGWRFYSFKLYEYFAKLSINKRYFTGRNLNLIYHRVI